ncbi:MAG: DUF2029 domain-containing protein [Proteobacteria bacterium]|nr:DUF2029 domain-containing protein [Pseudomonadota bacterium]
MVLRDRGATAITMDTTLPSVLSRCGMTCGGNKGLFVFCALCGLAGWALWTFILAREAGQDWMVFYTAIRTYFDGELGRVFDGHWVTETINRRYADWLWLPLNYHPWLYPPHFLLLLLPFGLLPFAASYALFLALTFALLVMVLANVSRPGLPIWFITAALLLFPQTAFIAFTGQNSFLTAALLIAGIGLLERQPVLAGLILGIISYKPQLFLMIPVALLAGRHWAAILAGIASTAALALASVAVFGTAVWQDWLHTMLASGGDTYQEWVLAARRGGQSLYACLLALGVPPLVCDLAQGAATLASAGIVWWGFRRKMPVDLRLMLLLAAVVFAAPHLSCQDAILLAAAALLLFRRIGDTRPYTGETPLIGAIWFAELFSPPALLKLGLIVPVVIALFMAAVIRRARSGG